MLYEVITKNDHHDGALPHGTDPIEILEHRRGSFPGSRGLAVFTGRLDFRRASRRCFGQVTVLGISGDLAIGVHRPHNLLRLLVVRGASGERREAERVLLVRRGRSYNFV